MCQPNCSHRDCQNPAVVKITQGGCSWYGCMIHQEFDALDPVMIETIPYMMIETYYDSSINSNGKTYEEMY